MKIILAQGNPGPRYVGTRHNVGFDLIDRFAREHGASWNEKSKFHSLIAEVAIDGDKVVLAKPTTFYNETGRAGRALADFYKTAPGDILVIHDELALPFGTIRTRSSGSDAGNNGVKSLNAALGQEYKRLRVGVYSELRDRMDDSDFVVGMFSREESEAMDDVYELARGYIDAFVNDTHVDETQKIQ